MYDIWESLYGKDFADRMVEVEKKRKGLYDYESAWKWALSMSKEERATRFKALKDSTGKAAMKYVQGNQFELQRSVR